MAKEKIGAVICDLQELLFPVEVREETMASNKEYSYKVVGKLNGADFLCNQCSDIYQLVPNSDIFPNIKKIELIVRQICTTLKIIIANTMICNIDP